MWDKIIYHPLTKWSHKVEGIAFLMVTSDGVKSLNQQHSMTHETVAA